MISKKNLVFSIIIALFAVSNLSAQLSLGGRVGVSFSSWKQDDLDASLKSGLDAAAIAILQLNERFSIDSELRYINKGFQIKNALLLRRLNYTYLEIPVLLGVHFQKKNLLFRISGGPTIGYLIGGKTKVCPLTTFDETCESEKINLKDDEINRTEFGLTGGAGIGFKTSTGSARVMFDLRYFRGLSNIFDANYSDNVAKNRGFTIGFSFIAPLVSDDLVLKH